MLSCQPDHRRFSNTESCLILIDQIAIAGYRSIRSIILRLGKLNVVTGANGSGKSNVYRALKLIADAAAGRLAESIAREGGFSSVRWAGAKSNGKDPVSLRLGFSSQLFSYCFDLGLPIPSNSAFDFDAEMKRECLWHGVSMPVRLKKDDGATILQDGDWLSQYGWKWSSR